MTHRIAIILICSSVALTGCQNLITVDPETLPPPAALPPQSLQGEVQIYYWDNIAGTSVDSLVSLDRFPENPDTSETINELSRQINRGDSYGALIRGYILPPESGVYRFAVSGDDETQFWLAESADPETLLNIASVPGWTSRLNYSKYSAQISGDIVLETGQRYYFELIFKEGGGNDHFSVAWEGPGFSREIITGDYLASYAGEKGLGESSAKEIYRLGYSVGFFDATQALAFKPQYPPLDQDEDGLYDNWELANGLDPNDPADAVSDPDNDLLVAADEFLLGTSENNPDTDGDGIPDGAEFALQLDPLDASDASGDLDGDGASNLDEYLAGTDPSDSNSVPEAEQQLIFAQGFVGQYFQGTEFDQFLVAQRETEIQFRAGSGSFVEQQPNDDFSARWLGEFTAPHNADERTYTFRVTTDDGVRLFVGGQLLISQWRNRSPTTNTAQLSLAPGEAATLVMEYYERGGGAVAEFSITDEATGENLQLANVVRSPDVSEPVSVDTDNDGMPDTWELRNGLLPWADDAAAVNNVGGVTNLEAFQTSVSPWTLEPQSSPESPAMDEGQTAAPVLPDTAVTLTWTAPLTRVDGSSIALSEIASYEIYYGPSPDELSNTMVVSVDQTSAEISDLASGTWYFSISVIDTEGLKSEPSEVVSKTVP